tara:strand:+ start:31603 stop:32220 length:618 start_codon:yes stop_codon:yes gene_type:complete
MQALNQNRYQIVLASSSVFRKKLMSNLNLDFITNSPDIDESPRPNELPWELSSRLSKEKALAVKQKLYNNTDNQKNNYIIIGSDQVAICKNKIYGKPLNYEKAVKYLKIISGNTVYFYTGLAVINTKLNTIEQKLNITEVKFRAFSEKTIENYIEKTQPFYSTLAIKAEELGITLIESIYSKDPNALIGLPLIDLSEILINFKIL